MKAAQIGVALRGDRNQCAGCHRLFNSTYAFDKHRTGRHGIDRRCMTVKEMVAFGMEQRPDGFWVGAPRDVGTIPKEVV